MNIDQRTLDTLEFDTLVGLLSGHVRTPLGRRVLAELRPRTDLAVINGALDLTSECVEYLKEGGNFDLSDIAEPEQALTQLHIEGASLDPTQILSLERLIGAGMNLRDQFRSGDVSARYPRIASICRLPDLTGLLKSIRGKILPNGELDDNASPELHRIRRQINSSRARIYGSLESIMRDKEGAIQDELVTMRNGRFVIPVRTDSRGLVNGVVHGLSSSGVTSYVEPLTVIEQNNDLVRLREQEEIETTRILLSITAALSARAHDIRAIAEAIGNVDAIQAKARFARQFTCKRPQVSVSRLLSLTNARHPLLEHNLKRQGGNVTPTSLTLDEDHQVLVVSGPNAGGKTVVLKTVGLMALMAQMGLHVPAEEATLPMFDQIFTDIGDQQSIAANLSTFTAHIRNVSEMMAQIRPPALVLIDEPGTGTDPDEGAALGIAVIDYFRVSGATTIATTHYNKLKVWASQTEGVINACVEFDEETLSPTYRLITGIAGASSGLEIARRVGLPEPTINQARISLDGAHEQANEYLKRLKALVDAQQASLEALEQEREATAEKYARLDLEFAQRESGRRTRFEAELARIVDGFKAESDRLIREIGDKAIAARLKRDAEARMSELRASGARLRKQSVSVVGPEVPPPTAVPPIPQDQPDLSHRDAAQGPIKERDLVLVSTLGQQGKVETIEGDTYTVAVGSLKYRARRSELTLVGTAGLPHPPRPISLPSGVTAEISQNESFSTELNVIGSKVDEAVDRVDKFLDKAFLAGAESVRIVHGHGKGALRQAVSNLLSGHPHIDKFQLAPPSEGGAGATIATLRK